ncbi:MAG: response regulator, partial [Desulfomonile sp.]
SEHGTANILLAEDNAINRTLAIRILQKAGHQVTCAENGLEVLKLMADAKFDMILMDISMPEMDGFEATRRIRDAEKKDGTHIPIIAMTAHALSDDRGKCLAAGMDDYISKPVNVEELLDKIDLYIGYREKV